MGITLIFFSAVWEIGYLVNCLFYKFQGLRGEKNGQIYGKWKKYGHRNILYTPISNNFPQIPGLRFGYPSIKFGYEINLNDLSGT